LKEYLLNSQRISVAALLKKEIEVDGKIMPPHET
jgi:hypothetical protein